MAMDWDPVLHYQEIAVAERYDRERFSSMAGKIFNRLEKYYVAQALRGLPLDTEILDLPCGTGRLADVLLNKGYRVRGVDVSPAMLEVAKRRVVRYRERFQAQVLDIFCLPEDVQPQYDAALCARVLMHFELPDQIRFLRNVARLTRHRVIFTQSLSTPYHRARRGFKRMIGNQASAAHPITNSELRELLAASGLRETRRLRPSRMLTEEVIVIAEKV